jgi:membrane protease subunit HflK
VNNAAPPLSPVATPVRRKFGANPRGWRWLLAAGALALGVGGWLSSGFYTVKADERGVVRRFGEVTGQVGPGIHYRLPWPIGRIDIVKTTSVMKAGAGFALPQTEAETVTGVEFLTGDTNIIAVALALQYVVRDPADFLVRVEDPRGFIGALAQSVVSETIATMSVDEVLTTGRLRIQEAVRGTTQAVLDRHRSGMQIISVNIMTITLDRAVAEAFQEVADAMADREKTQNEAATYASAIIPKARGERRASVGEAQNYKRQRVAEAIGETARFLAVLTEYKKQPEVSRTRLYLEAMERALGRAKLYVVDPGGGGAPLTVRVIAP